MALGVGSVFAGYVIEEVVGSGGMGVVYRARHPSLPRSDAVKVLSEEFSRDDEIRRRFLLEAELAVTLEHPNIVTVHDRGEYDDRLWIAMQFIDGSDAEKEIKAGRMTPRRAVRIINEVAAALDHAHRRQILHRDVKPANFLLTAGDERIYLADFGIARVLDDAAARLTQTGNVMASVAYISPESLKGSDAVDQRSDIYSLGAALYHLLTGKPPFFRSNAGGLAGVAAAHLFEAPPKVTDLAPALPAVIDAVVAKAMAKSPDDRYQSARDLAAAAAQALTGTAGAATSNTQPWQTRPVEPARPAVIPDPPTAAEITYPSGHFSGPSPAPPIAAYTLPPPPKRLPPRRRRAVMIGALALVVVTALAVAAVLWLRSPNQPAYQAQTFAHIHGSNELTAAPLRVAALGPGDADAVLSLGVQPVAMTAPTGQLPSWEQPAVTGSPNVLSAIDTAAVAAAKPDLIIATGDLSDTVYGKLAAIAKTITRPTEHASQGWSWQNQLSWIGRILGRQPKAEELLNSVRSLQSDLSNQNPTFSGKSIEAVTVSDTGVDAVLTPSFAADYLESLGFRYNRDLARNPVDTGATRPIADPNQLYGIETDVLVVMRADSAAGQGGFAGLPKPLTTYAGKMVIVDDPNDVAALTEDPGGYLATKYLDDHIVPELSAP
jgi:serine/threonine protein kinase/ABC-type Fe3+-hydroxamate transport system substrate-binding protein